MVWFEEKTAQPPRGPEGGDGATTEKTAMQVIGQEEIQAEQMTALFEKVASLEKANEEKERKINEMEMKVTLLTQAMQENEARCATMERAITEIAQNIQRQDLFNDSASTSISGLVEEVRKHQDYFQEVVRIFQNHEEHIRGNDVVSDGMGQYINALVQDTEKKRLWIEGLMKEAQAQAQVLRQHEMGQHVIAEVIKGMMNHQQTQQHQSGAGTGPVVTDVDDDNGGVLDFRECPSPHSGPPDIGSMTMTIQPVRFPTQMEVEKTD